MLSDTEENLNGIPVVSSSRLNKGITKRISFDKNLKLFPKGSLSVAINGSILETFIQPESFYTTTDIKVLSPKFPMSARELLFYKMAIKLNAYRYNYGRKASKTLPHLKLPPVPQWVYDYDIEAFRQKICEKAKDLRKK